MNASPGPLKREFASYEISTIEEAGLKGLKNGELLRKASVVYEILITVDKNIQHQQDKGNLRMAILIISARTNRIESLLPLIPRTLAALEQIKTGEIIIVE